MGKGRAPTNLDMFIFLSSAAQSGVELRKDE